MPKDKMITIKEGAKLTGYSEEYIRRLARAGQVQSQKIGASLLISRTDLQEHKTRSFSRWAGGLKLQT